MFGDNADLTLCETDADSQTYSSTWAFRSLPRSSRRTSQAGEAVAQNWDRSAHPFDPLRVYGSKSTFDIVKQTLVSTEWKVNSVP
jgi:hypothetical protein